MPRLPRLSLYLAVILAAVPVGLFAQSVSSAVGSIGGVVKDETGAALPGAGVQATSQERGASRSATSDAFGRFLFPQLQPGRYRVTVSLAGFQTVILTDNLVETEKRTELSVTLKLAKEKAEVTVTGEVPIVDKTNTSLETRFRQKEFEKMPVGRSFQALFLNAPGVNLPPGANPNPNVHGALSSNNQWVFDGADITDPTTGTFGGNLNFEAIQEVSILTSGVSAEYGRATGGIINIITKSGTNDLAGSFKVVMTNDNWNAQNKTKREDTGASLERVKFDHVNPRYAATLGGPFWKDHIWFFGAYESADETSGRQTTPISGENFQQTTKSRFWAGKLTGQITPSMTLQARGNSSPTDGFVVAYGRPADLPAYTGQNQTSQVYLGQWTGVFGSNATGEASYNWNGPSLSQSKSFIDVAPIFTSPTPTSPFPTGNSPHFSRANSFYYNGAFFDGFVKRPRQGVTAAGTYYAELGGNSHSFKAGFDWQKLTSSSKFGFPTNQVYIDSSFDFRTRTFVPFQRRDYAAPVASTSDGTVTAGYVRDKFEFGKRLFFEVGLRFEHQSGNDDISRSTVSSNTISPRFSANYDVTGNGKTLIVGTYGRFYQFLTQGFSDAFGQNVQRGEYDNLNWNGTAYVFSNHVSSAGSAVQPNPDLKPPRVDEGTLGIRQQIGNILGVSLTGIYRKWGSIIDDIVTLDSAGNQTTRYVNYDEVAKHRFYGIEFIADKRFSQNWNVNFNYTYSRTEGNNFSDTGSPLGNYLNSMCYAGADPRRPVPPDDPTIGNNGFIPCSEVNNGPNNDGRAVFDQAHNLKLLGAYVRSLGPVNLALGLGGQLSTGLPYTKTRTLTVLIPGTNIPAGPTADYLYEKRGSDVLPTIWQIDSSIEATFTVWRTVELGVKGEVFNIFDQQKARGNPSTPFGPNLTTWCGDTSPTATTACKNARSTYGSNTSRNAFQPPRNYRLTALVRF